MSSTCDVASPFLAQLINLVRNQRPGHRLVALASTGFDVSSNKPDVFKGYKVSADTALCNAEGFSQVDISYGPISKASQHLSPDLVADDFDDLLNGVGHLRRSKQSGHNAHRADYRRIALSEIVWNPRTVAVRPLSHRWRPRPLPVRNSWGAKALSLIRPKFGSGPFATLLCAPKYLASRIPPSGRQRLAPPACTAAEGPVRSTRSTRASIRRRAIVAVIAASCALALSGCQGSTDAGPAPTTSAATTPSPTATTPAWQSRYTKSEIAVYEAALGHWGAYERASEQIWARGSATPAAKKLFQKYLTPWQAYWAQLMDYEQQKIRIGHNAETLSSEPTRIKIAKDGVSVSIRQCVDSTKIGAIQDGTPLRMAFTTPQLRDVNLNRADGRWLVSQIKSSTKDRPCGG